MANIKIPQNLIEVKRQVLQINSKTPFTNLNQCTLFTNPNNSYTLDIPNNCNIIQEFNLPLFWPLNVKGSLQLNFPCSLYATINQTSIPEDRSYGYDTIPNKELIFNFTDKNNSHCSLNFYNQFSETKTPCEKIIIKNASLGACINVVDHVGSIKDIEIDAPTIKNTSFNCDNLKSLKMPNLTDLSIDHHSSSASFFNPNNQLIPNDCILTLNKNIKINVNMSSLSKIININSCPACNDQSLINFINQQKTTSYKENNDNTFSIRYDELKNIIETAVLDLYTLAIKEQKKNNLKKQEEIANSIKSSNKIKER